MTSRPLLVLDSASLYYRSYFALPSSMTAPDGRPHNAIRGFLSTVARLVEAHHPSGLVAAWDDDWRPQWRVDLVPTYKAHRVAEGDDAAEAEPEDLGVQAEAIAALLDALGIARWGLAEYEADDIAGSTVTQYPGPSVVVTGDRDLVQLVSARTRVHLTVNGGMDRWPLLDPAGVIERFGVPADHYVDLAVLRGDPSDGLPGVAGIGAKTAAALVGAFGGIDAILQAAAAMPDVRPMTPRLSAALLDARSAIESARTVARVVTDLPLPRVSTSLPVAPANPARVAALSTQWGVARQVDDLFAAVASQTDDE